MKICPRCSELFTVEGSYCPACGVALVATTDAYLGRTIAGRYYLTKRLGGGGMAVVYLARHVIIERLSALKILRPDLTANPSHRERFLREARAVNRINHRNIVEITDYGETEGMVYLVMEYVSGGSLQDSIREGAFGWVRAARLAMQVASALARAHQAGVIHRDLKPENILLVAAAAGDASRPAEGEQVKLTDFGIAKIVDAPALTFSEQLFGTPGYIAPEYIEGAPASVRTDLYALGVCLYEMVCSKLPFESRGDMGLLMQPLIQPPIPPSARIQGIPPDVEALILQLLAREPRDRPRDAFAVHDALATILRRYGSAPVVPTKVTSPRLPLDRTLPLTRDATSAAWLQRGLKEDPSVPAHLLNPPPSSREPENRGTPENRVAMLARATMRMTSPTASREGSWWEPALVELSAAIARERRRGGPHMLAAERATELAEAASEIASRIERASQAVAALQRRVDDLSTRGREFRAALGRAIDALVHDRSRERARLEVLRAQEGAGVTSELASTRAMEADLTYQIDTLQKQLDTKNEGHDHETVDAVGGLEGSLAALQQMMGDLSRTLEEATAIVSHRRS